VESIGGVSYLVHLDLVSGAAGESLVVSAGHVALVLGELNRLGSAHPVVTALRDNVLATVQYSSRSDSPCTRSSTQNQQACTILSTQGRASERGVVLELEDASVLEVLLADSRVIDPGKRDQPAVGETGSADLGCPRIGKRQVEVDLSGRERAASEFGVACAYIGALVLMLGDDLGLLTAAPAPKGLQAQSVML